MPDRSVNHSNFTRERILFTLTADKRDPPDGENPQPEPDRVAPENSLSEIVERLVQRRHIQPGIGDVIVKRERVPGLNPRPMAPPPWRYRVQIFGQPANSGHTFSSFPHAASEAEHVASRQRLRVLYLEEDAAALLADYRS